jgi:ATP-grasp domain, R2K clade family 2
MPTLLLSARQTDDAQKLWRACIAEKWEVVRVHGWRVPEISSKDVAVYGEPLFAHHVAQSLGLRLLEPPIDWLPKLPHRWRCRDVQLSTLGEARNTTWRSFIKPADEKCFDARIYSSGADLPTQGPLPEDMPVLVQEIVQWTTEFRCFVLDRKLLTASPYWHNGQLAKSEDGSWFAGNDQLEDAIRFCNSVLEDKNVSLPDAIALDVGIIQDSGWAVVECNAAFSSGIYGCDPVEVLRVLRRACNSTIS